VESADSPRETLRQYGRLLRRSWWLIAVPAILVPLAAVLVSLTQTPLYRATTPVLLTRQNVPPTGDQILFPDRFIQGQAKFARSPQIMETAAEAADVDRTGAQLASNSEVVPSRVADILLFAVTDGDRKVARRLARAYAVHYTLHRRAFDRAQVEAALEQVDAQIAGLRDARQIGTGTYRTLLEQRRALRTSLATRTSDAFVIEDDELTRVRPQVVRDAAFALVLGLGLGLAMALVRQSLDRRIRSSREVAALLGLPVLGRIPARREPRRRRARGPATPPEPAGEQADALRLLRTNLDTLLRSRGLSSILVTAATAAAAAPALEAQIARSFGRSGRSVLLADVDVYRTDPEASEDSRQLGVTDVVAGGVALADVIVQPEWASAQTDPLLDAPVQVVPRGTAREAGGDLYASPRLARVLASLCETADVVIVNGPSAERAADVIALAATVESVLVVASLEDMRRDRVTELRRVLEAVSAVPLGVVITAAELDEDPAPVAYQSEATARASSAAR